jgi:hypothetical protein
VLAEEVQPAGFVRGGKRLEHEPPEQRREDKHRQEEAAPAGDPAAAIRRDAAAWRDRP